jgi:epoxyqueuosine reductase
VDLAERLSEAARGAGFDLAGIAPIAPPPDAERFRAWIADGRHADMDWLERNAERIADPRAVLSDARWMLVVGLGHARAAHELEGGGRIARYALGRDYHNLIGKRLKRLARELVGAGLARRARVIVDAGPLLERSHAAVAGVGFPSKAANLLHRRLGPWFFLGELLLDTGSEDPTPAADRSDALGSCGTCTACLDACPTQAITAPGQVDARLCISYQTIENRGAIPPELRARIGEWVFGCDVCSEVCPFGTRAPDASERFGEHPGQAGTRLADWLGIPEEAAFRARFEGSPLRRPGRGGLLRNAALVLGNRPSDAGRTALERALGDSDPRVRAAAGWALVAGHGADVGSRAAVERAAAREHDEATRADLLASLDRA